MILQYLKYDKYIQVNDNNLILKKYTGMLICDLHTALRHHKEHGNTS